MEISESFAWVYNSSSLKFSRVLDRLLVQIAHAKRDIVVAGCTSGGTSFDKGDALSPGRKSVPSTHKEIAALVQPQKGTRPGLELTTYGCNFKPMVNFHWGAGTLSRGSGHV
jgi:hypothetical protein